MTAKLHVDPDGRGIWLGDRHVPWAQVLVDTYDFPDIDLPSFRRRQALLPFENGLVLSLVWGSGTYSSNYPLLVHPLPSFTEEPTNVELAIRQETTPPDGPLPTDGLVRFGEDGDTVEGHVAVAFLGAWIDFVAGLPSGTVAVDEDAVPRDDDDA